MVKGNEGKRVYRVGFVGYCPPSKYDENQAKQYIKKAFDKIEENHPREEIELVSGATDVGTLKQAYEEAYKRGWRLTGIASKKAKDYTLNPHLSKKFFVGDDWGKESPKFLQYLRHGTMIKVGGGKQSIREANAMKRMGNEVLEYDLPLLNEDSIKKGIEKIKQIINSDSISIQHYKNLKHDLKDFKRVHIDMSFVLVFKVDIQNNHILFVDFDHHDKVYK